MNYQLVRALKKSRLFTLHPFRGCFYRMQVRIGGNGDKTYPEETAANISRERSSGRPSVGLTR